MKTTIAKALAVMVAFVGIMVMDGWVLGIPAFTSILPQWATMKFMAAFSFLLSGLMLYVVAQSRGKISGTDQTILIIFPLCIVLIMATLLISAAVGIQTGVENLFVQESTGAVQTTVPGNPGIGTMVGFLFIAIAGTGSLSAHRNGGFFVIFGTVIAIIGGSAVLGYAANAPMLYYYVPGVSTAMAFHAAILFICSGVSFICIGLDQRKKAHGY